MDSRLEEAKTTQWWICKCIKDFDLGSWSAHCKNGGTGVLTILKDGQVIFWIGGRYSMYGVFDSIDKAKEFLTCVKKTSGQVSFVIDAWNRAVQ